MCSTCTALTAGIAMRAARKPAMVQWRKQAQKNTGFKLKALLYIFIFKESKFETGCFQDRVKCSLHHPTMATLSAAMPAAIAGGADYVTPL